MGLDEGLKPDTWIAALAGGLVMGVIHVVTGADHLSAVAMLSSGNDRWTALHLGIRWGMGHCVGLLAVFAAVLIASAELDKTSVRGVEEYMGVVVGLLMIGLGAYGLWDASRVTRDASDASVSSTRYGSLGDLERGDTSVKRALFVDSDDDRDDDERDTRDGNTAVKKRDPGHAEKGGDDDASDASKSHHWRSLCAVGVGVGCTAVALAVGADTAPESLMTKAAVYLGEPRNYGATEEELAAKAGGNGGMYFVPASPAGWARGTGRGCNGS